MEHPRTPDFNHNPLYNPKYKPQPVPYADSFPKSPIELQRSASQYQWKQYPTNHNLHRINSLHNNRINQNEQKYNESQNDTGKPKGIKHVKFAPKTRKKPPKTARVQRKRDNPQIKANNHQSNNSLNQPNYDMNRGRAHTGYIHNPYPHPQMMDFNPSPYGQQWTPNGVIQQRPHSEPILKHTQSDVSQQSFNNEPRQHFNTLSQSQSHDLHNMNIMNNLNRGRAQTQHNNTGNHHKNHNAYRPKANDANTYTKVAHMYTIRAHFENMLLSVEVYDAVQGQRFRNEFCQNDFPMYPIFDIAKILVEAVNSSQSGQKSISVNGFKPITISEHGGWCYLTVNGAQMPSFALRPSL